MLSQLVPFIDFLLMIVNNFLQGLSFCNSFNILNIFYRSREYDSPRIERSMVVIESLGEATLQAFIEAVYELPNEFILGFDLD